LLKFAVFLWHVFCIHWYEGMKLPVSTPMAFNEWLRLKRCRSGLSQKKLGEALSVSSQTVSSWETGESFPKLTPHQMRELCQLLSCSLDELADYQIGMLGIENFAQKAS
jgi:transcriptional regulator with XRE-family HTH domain